MKINPPGYWTIDRVADAAKRFETRAQFQRGNNTAYVIAYRRGWLDHVCMHMVPAGNIVRRFVYRIWSEETREVYIGLAADWRRRYSIHKSTPKAAMRAFISRPHNVEPITASPIAADKAAELECAEIERYKRAGWTVLNVARGGGLGGGKTKWTRDALFALAKTYETRLAMRAAAPSAYVVASRRRLLDEIFAEHQDRGLDSNRVENGTWTQERLRIEASRFATRKQMAVASSGAYLAAHRSGVLDDIFKNHNDNGLTKAWVSRRYRARLSD